MALSREILDFGPVFTHFMWDLILFQFHLSVSFRNFQLALSVFWQSYFQLPKLAWLFSKKKEPVEPENNSEKKKKVAHSQWNEKIDQFHKNTFKMMNQNLKLPMPLPHEMCLVKNVLYVNKLGGNPQIF